jgi:Uma2 family endonuclease
MNAPSFIPLPQPRPLLAGDVMFLVENGLIDPNARFELMDGVIVHMSPKGRFHEVMRERVEDWLAQQISGDFRVLREHTLIIDAQTIVEPDFILYDRARSIEEAPLTGADIRLAIEVADSSWSYDTTEKAAKYAAFGVDEYWVVHAVNRSIRVHLASNGGIWSNTRDVVKGEALAPRCAPTAALSL